MTDLEQIEMEKFVRNYTPGNWQETIGNIGFVPDFPWYMREAIKAYFIEKGELCEVKK